MIHARSLLALTLVALSLSSAAAQATTPEKTEWGYIPMADGAQLRYEAWLPKGEGPFPVLMNYEGYQAGTAPDDSIPELAADALDHGYAVVGVSLRGSGCSDGTWQLFNKQQGEDGAAAVDWLAQRPWANGKVALFSYSYGGIMQTWVAAMRPKHLVAAGPGNVVADTYRDIGFPGGMTNYTFPPAWGVILNVSWKNAAQKATEEGDTRCAPVVAQHTAAATNNMLLADELQHPYDDQWHYDHSVKNIAKNIDVPVLGIQAWQDEEVGARGGQLFNLLDPEKTWLVATNGYHELLTVSKPLIKYELEFFDHFVKGVDNGFEKRPHVQIWNETSVAKFEPRSITSVDRLPVKVDEADIPLGPQGLQSDKGADASSYDYPVPAPAVADASGGVVYETEQDNTWPSTSDTPNGRAAFTTPPLAHTVTTYGPASADLWISTTAPDVDLQATITEVRPDGQEMYVQRGWLRASDRALDAPRSTLFTPFHPYTQAAAADMPAGKPQLARVDVFPFSHTFRKGSSIRLYVEMPSLTGLWNFKTVTTQQTVTVHHDAAHPSRLVLGVLPQSNVEPTLPACGTVQSQACRANPVPQPAGSFDVRTTPVSTSTPPKSSGGRARGRRLVARFLGRRHAYRGGVVVRLERVRGRFGPVVVELRRRGRVWAHSARVSVAHHRRTVVLRRSNGKRFPSGHYTLIVRSGRTVVVERTVRLGRSGVTRSVSPTRNRRS